MLFVHEAPESTDVRLREALFNELMTNAADKINNKLRLRKQAKKAGEESAEARRHETNERNKKIADRAKRLLSEGVGQRDLAGMLSEIYSLSATQIRKILENDGVREIKRK